MTQEKQLGKLIKKINKGEGVQLKGPQIIGYNFYYIVYIVILFRDELIINKFIVNILMI